MFPTDRWHWSSEDGKIQCPRESFKLPSGCWSWDGDWFLDTSIPCDEDVSIGVTVNVDNSVIL